MMTNEEILKEVKTNFQLEGVIISREQEDRIKKYLYGEVPFEDLINTLKEKYSNYECDV